MAKLVIEIPDELKDLGEALATMVARVQGTVAGTGGGLRPGGAGGRSPAEGI